jgi:hypothetical protein
VDRPTICQSIRMERLCRQDSNSKLSYETKAILIFKNNSFYKGVP